MNSMGSGTFIKIGRAIITSGSGDLSDRIYVEQDDRACGTMLSFTKTPSGYAEGDVVEVLGTVMTINGERAIQGATLSKIGHIDPIKPLGITNRWIGGGRLGLKSGVRNGQSLNNIGLLVKVWGRVIANGWDYFYVDDGSTNSDGSGIRGLKVVCGSMSQPPVGTMVSVTGISSIETPPRTTIRIPIIWARRSSDISLMP